MLPHADKADPPNRSKWCQSAALALTAVIAIVIGGLTLAPSVSPSPKGLALTDKAYHAIAFAALVLPTSAVYRGRLLWILTMVFLYGAMIEVIQPYVGRGAEWADLAANAVGILIGLALGRILHATMRLLRTEPFCASDQ